MNQQLPKKGWKFTYFSNFNYQNWKTKIRKKIQTLFFFLSFPFSLFFSFPFSPFFLSLFFLSFGFLFSPEWQLLPFLFCSPKSQPPPNEKENQKKIPSSHKWKTYTLFLFYDFFLWKLSPPFHFALPLIKIPSSSFGVLPPFKRPRCFSFKENKEATFFELLLSTPNNFSALFSKQKTLILAAFFGAHDSRNW